MRILHANVIPGGDMFRFLFGGGNGRNDIRFSAGRKTSDLEARLTPVNGYTGRGEIEFSSWQNGSRQLEVELRGVAGRTADVYINGERVKTVNLENGRVDAFYDTRQGDALPDAVAGDRVEVRQNGDPILDGVLRPD
jgi:hypothetical protein